MAETKPVYFYVPKKDDKSNKKKACSTKKEADALAKKQGGKVYGPYYRKTKASKKKD